MLELVAVKLPTEVAKVEFLDVRVLVRFEVAE